LFKFDYSIYGLPRKRRRHPGSPDIIAPAPERLQHGKVERLDKPIADDLGAIARPYRAVDTLAIMERRGTITAGMRQAGETFRVKFTAAHLEPLRAANLYRTARSNYGGDALGLKIENAREYIWRAICAVGGVASAGGACLWHVVGLEQSLKEWALTQGWSGRRMTQEAASG
jgi:hypothetical protein